MAKIFAITGGIGSGKSVISKVLRTLGYLVFDCDTEAKRIMDYDSGIKARIADEISPEIISEGNINRKLLSEIVFNDSRKLQKLNNIVHAAVKEAIIRWADANAEKNVIFIETAILYTSGLCNHVDGEIRVSASEDLRIKRVVRRNNLPVEHIKARMKAQESELLPSNPVATVYNIINSDDAAVLPQVIKILGEIAG